MAVQFFYQTVHEDPLLDKGWIAITNFYNKNKNYQKALYYINKAINIDEENAVYWKLYATINERLKLYEESERGYKKTLELGNYELDTWLSRADVLILLGEYQAAIYNLNQAAEFHSEQPEIQYRLAGSHFKINESEKGYYHLKNALRSNNEYYFIIEELFPNIYNRDSIQNLITEFKNASE